MPWDWEFDAAPIMARREGDSIVVEQPVNSVKNTRRFAKDVRSIERNVHGNVFSNQGGRLRPDELVGVRLYDEGEKVVVVEARQLLEFARASDRAVYTNIVATALSAGSGVVAGKVASSVATRSFATRLAVNTATGTGLGFATGAGSSAIVDVGYMYSGDTSVEQLLSNAWEAGKSGAKYGAAFGAGGAVVKAGLGKFTDPKVSASPGSGATTKPPKALQSRPNPPVQNQLPPGSTPPVQKQLPPGPTPPVQKQLGPGPTPPVQKQLLPGPTPPVQKQLPPGPTAPVQKQLGPGPTPPVQKQLPPGPTPPVQKQLPPPAKPVMSAHADSSGVAFNEVKPAVRTRKTLDYGKPKASGSPRGTTTRPMKKLPGGARRGGMLGSAGDPVAYPQSRAPVETRRQGTLDLGEPEYSVDPTTPGPDPWAAAPQPIKPATPRAPRGYHQAAGQAAREARAQGLEDLQKGRVGMQEHRSAPVVRKATGQVGQGVDSTHIVGQAVDRAIGADPDIALTVNLPKAINNAIDNAPKTGWVPKWNKAQKLGKRVTGADYRNWVQEGIRNVPENLLSKRAKGTLEWALDVELQGLGIAPTPSSCPAFPEWDRRKILPRSNGIRGARVGWKLKGPGAICQKEELMGSESILFSDEDSLQRHEPLG